MGGSRWRGVLLDARDATADGVVVIYWYVYNPDGTPTFLIAVGTASGNIVQANVFYNSGMKFGEFNPADRTEESWGTMTFTVHSCNSATLQYNSQFKYNGVAFGSGSIALSRLLTIEGLQCSEIPNAGIYQGNFYSNLTGEAIPGQAVISPDGKIAVFSFDAMAGMGNWSSNGAAFSGSGTAVSADPDFTFNSNFTMSGQISAEYRVVGTYNVSGGDYGTFDFFALPALYRRGISLQAISGNYSAENLVSGATGSVSITASGGLNGSDSFGCKYSGQLTILDTEFNVYKVSVNVSGCGVSNGQYTGYGVQLDYSSLGDRRALRLVATNGTYAGVFDLYH